MSKLEELIEELCPDGVEYKNLWEVTAWDKKFNAVDKNMQKKVYKYPVLLAKDLFGMKKEEGNVFLLSTGTETGWTTEEIAGDYLCEGEVVTLPWGKSSPVCGLIKYYKGKFVTGDNRIATSIDTKILLNKYLYYWMVNNGDLIDTYYRGSGIKHPSMLHVLTMKLPIPPLPVQEEIVRILDNFTDLTAELQAELQARAKQYEYYFCKLVSKEKYPMVKLETIGSVKMCKRILKSQTSSEGEVPFYKIGTFGKDADAYISKELFDEYVGKYSYPQKGAILISCSGTIGRTVVFDGEPSYFQDSNIVWLEHDGTKVTNKYLKYAYKLNPWIISSGGTISRLYNDGILKAEIPLPSIEEQEKIVRMLEKFDVLNNDISIGLPAEIEARQKQYEYYRNKLLTFKELEA